MKWYECQSCGEEFRVITDSSAYVEYCPFCGSDVADDEDEDEEEFEEDQDYDFDE